MSLLFICCLFLVLSQGFAVQWEVCKVEGDLLSTCVDESECSQSSRIAGPCSSGVCCRPSRTRRQAPKKTASMYCFEALKQCDNGKFREGIAEVTEVGLTLSIAGGEVAPIQKHPHMALLGNSTDVDFPWKCGGTLINERFVLTAAHCVAQQLDRVRLGDSDYSTSDDDADPEDFEIERVIIHPEYKSGVYYNDLALIRLNRDVKFNKYKRPACIHTKPKVPYGKVVATGWGRTGAVQDLSSQLREVEISLLMEADCRRIKLPQPTIPNGIDGRIFLCAAERSGGKDTCSGDSGGPIVVHSSGRCLKTIVGVTSFGGVCAEPGDAGVYVRVSSYVPWIESVVWG